MSATHPYFSFGGVRNGRYDTSSAGCSTGPKKFLNGAGKAWIYLDCKSDVLKNATSKINRLGENPIIYRHGCSPGVHGAGGRARSGVGKADFAGRSRF
jgi:hypothetical protein